MNTKSVLGFVAILGLTLGRFQMAIADAQTVPVNELSLVEESEVACPICEALENGEEVPANSEAATDYSGHSNHGGGHSNHGGGHSNHGGGHSNHGGGHSNHGGGHSNHGGGHSNHGGGHSNHGGGHGSHWYDNNDSKSDSSQLPQPNVNLN